MAKSELNLYGPPGSGKTRRAIELFIHSVELAGAPDRVAAVTFTRTAAEELRARAAQALGIPGSAYELRRRMPWVGTIHSLCFGLLGARRDHMADLVKFARDAGQDVPLERSGGTFLPAEMDTVMPDFGFDVDAVDVEIMASILARARHTLRPLEVVAEDLDNIPVKIRKRIDVEHLLWLAREYAAWKRMHDFWDFEDLLEEGAQLVLPVRVIIADEVQDNSPLLWKVLDAWEGSPRVATAIHAGDPFQAIYSFAGADPHLFNQRSGKWVTVGDSHRFNQASAEYAARILRDAHAEQDTTVLNQRLSSWRGVGGEPRDGTKFILARTHRLLSAVRNRLIDEGQPFRQMRGRAPLQTKAADAYRAIIRLRQGNVVTEKDLQMIIDQAPPGSVPRGVRSAVAGLSRGQEYSQESAEKLLGRPIKTIQTALPYADYFRMIFVGRQGMQGLFMTPKTAIGTIHSAKGREADEVTLVRSWGVMPSWALQSSDGRIAEGCVAYVATTRHRQKLTIVDADEGVDYPFPGDPSNGGR